MDDPALRAVGVRWDLRELYDGPDDPRIEGDIAEARRRAEAFAQRYRGTVTGGQLDGAALARALAEYEAVTELQQRPAFYASLLFAADTQNTRVQQLVQRTREAATEIANLLVFFTLELIALEDDRFAVLLTASELDPYRHYLETLRRFRPHTLSEKEEQILNHKQLTGSGAFEQLYEELTGSLRFPLEIDGEERELTDGEVMALLRHPDRALRERAFATFLEAHARHSLVLTAIFNNILLDHKIDCALRHYDDVTLPTHLANEIAPETVEAMMQAVERHYPLAQEYFRLKARLLGLERLKNTDLYAPIATEPESIPFPRAQQLILAAFARFDEQFAAHAADFFTERWIDAEVRAGKRGGAFCAAYSPRHHPYILCSYNGTSRDVSTIAHELGHGIHYCLARRQTLLSYDSPLVLAETASVFAEMLLTRFLLERAESAAVRRALLCDTLEEMYGTVFRQTALTRFEMAAHRRRRTAQLSAEEIGALWWETQAQLFGTSVEMIPAYRWGWTYISHFIHSRFYCYAYAFGELLTLALYQRYVDEGPCFIPGYKRLLESGGSQRPERALAALGMDINQPEFWDQGFRVIRGLLDELRATC